MRPMMLLRPERRREIERPFGWQPCRLLTEGWLSRLGTPAKLLYFFLCLAADRRGLSWYGDARIATLLNLPIEVLPAARAELIDLDLVDFDGRVYQLLSLPRLTKHCASTPAQRQEPAPSQPAHSRGVDMPEEVGVTLRRLFGLD